MARNVKELIDIVTEPYKISEDEEIVMQSYVITDHEEKIMIVIKDNGSNIYFYNKVDEKEFSKNVYFITLKDYISDKFNSHKKNNKNKKKDKFIYIDPFSYCLKHNLYYSLNYLFIYHIEETYLYLNNQSNIGLQSLDNYFLSDIDKSYSIVYHFYQLIVKLTNLNEKDMTKLFSGNKNILSMFTAFNILLGYNNANLLLFNKHINVGSKIHHQISNYSIFILYELARLYNSKIYKKIEKIGFDKIIKSIIDKIINKYSRNIVQDIYGIFGITKNSELLLVSIIISDKIVSFSQETFVIRIINDHISKDDDFDDNMIILINWIIDEVGNKRTKEIYSLCNNE